MDKSWVALSVTLMASLILVGVFLYWDIGRAEEKRLWAEQELQKYLTLLKEDSPYVIEETNLNSFNQSTILTVGWFSEFQERARLSTPLEIYIDRENLAMFFISTKTEHVHVFYYAKTFS